MKKKLALGVILTLAASAPLATTASAGDPELPEYGGKIENKKSQFFGFDTQNNMVGNFETVNLPLQCKAPKQKLYGSGPISPSAFPIKQNGKFKVDEKVNPILRGTGTNGYRLWIEGKIKGKSAKGTIRIKTKGRECDSGKRDWKVKSPSPNRPNPKPNPTE